MHTEETEIYGLILSGGKSTRMGSDKGLLHYHGIPQREYLFKLASQFCDRVFYSAREDQLDSFPKNAPIIFDQNEYRGPLNGIMSAHQQFTDVALLVLACDLPLLDNIAIEKLIANRDRTKRATAFSTKASKLPEPLVAIWEPSALNAIPAYMKTSESSCPRKFLINSDIKLIFPNSDEVLYNANTINELNYAKAKVAE